MTVQRIDEIVALIRDCDHPLKWEELCKLVQAKTGINYTRQALARYHPIQIAYASHRTLASPKHKIPTSSAARKIQKLELQIKELEVGRDALLEKFARWAVNANSRGLDEAFLDQPLRRIDRSENR